MRKRAPERILVEKGTRSKPDIGLAARKMAGLGPLSAYSGILADLSVLTNCKWFMPNPPNLGAGGRPVRCADWEISL